MSEQVSDTPHVRPYVPKGFGPVPAQMAPHEGAAQMTPYNPLAEAMAETDQARADRRHDDKPPARIFLHEDDPFEAALIPIVETNRRKRADYALDGDPFSNFRGTAAFLGHPAWMSALFNCAQKLERIKSLSANGRLEDPKNEAVEDTILDNAVYGVIAWAIYRADNDKLRGEQKWTTTGSSS